MAKGWTKVNTVNDMNKNTETDYQKKRRIHNFENTTRNMKSLSAFDLKKIGDERLVEKIANEDQLLQAAEDNRLKSEKLIKKAEKIKKSREKAVNKENGDKKL